MRLVGELEHEEHARIFSDYLTQLGIDNNLLEESMEGTGKIYEIWVHSEDETARSEQLLKNFRENPVAPEYQGVSKRAKKIKKEAEREAKEHPGYMDARTTIFFRGATPNGSLTLLLILACLGVAVFSVLGKDKNMLRPFFIADFLKLQFMFNPGLHEIANGEIWRLFTPMFIHFDILHFVFNMMWLRDLGSMVEDRKGSLFLGIFVLVISASSNLSQYAVSGPAFGGMSGVVYGLLGYIWMKGKYDPASNLSLHKSTVTLMIGWFFLCLTGLMGPIANAAHAAGLAVGVAWGFLTSLKFRQITRKLKR